MAETVNYGLYKTSNGNVTFHEWREKLAGETDSNMVKIDAALAGKQNALADGDGTTVKGNAVNVDTPTRGIFSQDEFNALPADRKSKGLYVIDDGSDGPGGMTQEEASARFLLLRGGTMTGPLSVPAPTADAHAANKAYVDALFNQLAPVIVTVQYKLGSGNDAATVTRNVKCYPAGAGTLSYSINFSIPRASESINEITLISPEQYAFTGLYASSGVILENVHGVAEFGRIFGGNILLYPPDSSSDYDAYLGPYTITGSFTLEVA